LPRKIHVRIANMLECNVGHLLFIDQFHAVDMRTNHTT
jgi:hypothetical protein